jgi:V/A-type H+-transporting ATPase subunit E
MDAEQVVAKILSQSQVEADKITGEAKEKFAAEEAKLNESLSKYDKETKVLAAEAGEDKKARMMAGARMQLAKEHLAAKGEILNGVFDVARQQVKTLPDAEYVKLMSKLVVKACETGDEEVIVGKNETRIDTGFIKQVNRELGPGFKGNLRLSNETADIDGGFVLKRGNIQTNVSVDVLVAQIRSETEMDMAGELFE